MAFWDRETAVRALSGVLFVVVLVGASAWNVYSNSVLWLGLIFGAVTEFFRIEERQGEQKRGLFTKASVIAVALAGPIFFPFLCGQEFDGRLVWSFLLLVWTNDTLAYVFGRTLGRHKLMPKVSPGKTWEGFIGGILSAGAVSWALTGVPAAAFQGVLIGILATAGDLTESAWKRKHGIKDSGSIMPGHGGFLDRFDGFLYTTLIHAVFVLSFPDWWCR